MNAIRTKSYARITIHKARKLYDRGETVWALPCKMNPENMYMHPFPVSAMCNSVMFDAILNAIKRNNCSAELGRYLSYYVSV